MMSATNIQTQKDSRFNESPWRYPLDVKSERALRIAGRLCVEREKNDNAPIYSEALLVALNEDAHGPVRAMFSAFRYGRADFLQWQKDNDTRWGFEPQDKYEPDNDTPPAAYPFSRNTEAVLRQADQVRRRKNADHIRPRHLLAGIIEIEANDPSDNCIAFQWLNKMRIDIPHVRDVLSRLPESSPINIGTFILAPGKAFDDTDTDVDLLGFETSSLALAEIIAKPETKPPVVIGIYGDWGSGKSTYLSLVRKHLQMWDTAAYPKERRKRIGKSIRYFYSRLRRERLETQLPRIVCIRFNAWAYTDTTKLWAGLVKEVSARIDREIPLWRKPFFWFRRSAWRLAAALLIGLLPLFIALLLMIYNSYWAQLVEQEPIARFLTWLTAVGSSILIFYKQMPLTSVVTSLVKNFDKSHAEGVMSSIQEELSTTIERYFTPDEPGADSQDKSTLPKKKLKIVILIDELDRCQLEKIVDILEAIKLFLAEKIFIVLMAVDTRVITEAIKLHYKDADNPKLAYEYVEKIIQVPISVPRANHDHLAQYVRNLMGIDETEEKKQTGTPPLIVPDPDQADGLNRPFANSTDPLKPLQLPDTSTERRAITNFAATFLEGNPRRIKRLLNTYRYVKTLATRLGEKTDNEEWQAKMINWLGLTMRWPTFMQGVVDKTEGRTNYPDYKDFLKKLRKELPESLRPPEDALVYVPLADDLKHFSVIANNFLVENRMAIQQQSADKPSKNEKDEV